MKAVDIPEKFGKRVFNDRVMKQRLPEKDYIAVRRAIEFGEPLTHETAKVVASFEVKKGAGQIICGLLTLRGLLACRLVDAVGGLIHSGGDGLLGNLVRGGLYRLAYCLTDSVSYTTAYTTAKFSFNPTHIINLPSFFGE